MACNLSLAQSIEKWLSSWLFFHSTKTSLFLNYFEFEQTEIFNNDLYFKVESLESNKGHCNNGAWLFFYLRKTKDNY